MKAMGMCVCLYLAHIDLGLVLASGRAGLSEERRAVTVRIAVNQGNGFVEGLHTHAHEHRAKDLFGVTRHFRSHIRQNCGGQEIALRVTRHLHRESKRLIMSCPIQHEVLF
jgi:hypothetical protein